MFAIAPPIAKKLTFLIKFSNKLILVDIFDPPIIAITGLFILLLMFSNISNSSCKDLPTKEGKNFDKP